MKRLLTLFVAAAVALMAYPAFATINGTPHDYLGQAVGGRCEVCHVPHAASATTAKRLWRTDRSITNDGSWTNSTVGMLCGTCHNSAVINAANAAGEPPHAVGTTVYAATSHGRDWATLDGTALGKVGGFAANPNGKPYTNSGNIEAGKMECTSCHNVHFDGAWAAASTKRPFLREGAVTGSVSGFCADCHNDRFNNGTVGVNNLGNADNGNLGNHPVNIAYTDSGVNGGATFVAVASMPTALKSPVSTTAWSLGGKFEGSLTGAPTAADNIGCHTCHAVHNPGAGTDQANHLLAINNVAANAALCEGCHGAPSGNAARANSGATMQVGSALGDHPIDCAIAAPGPTIDRWYADSSTTRAERHTVADNNWPRGTGGNIICTSCHSAHKARAYSAGPPVIPGKLTRTGGNASWCNSCHADASPAGHHSHTGNYAQSKISCSDCHGGAGSSAHNGFIFNANFAGGIASNNASQLCNMCHISAPQTDPVRSAEINWGPTAMPANHLGAYSTNGVTSHFLGSFAASNNLNSINVKRSSWSATDNAFSKFGAAADTHGVVTDAAGTDMICESCHSVLHNVGASQSASPGPTTGYAANLLLQNFSDDGDGTAGSKAIGSGLCIGCHNTNGAIGAAAGQIADNGIQTAANVPAGTHPLTTWQVTRAQDAGRATTTLVTDVADGTYAAAGTAPTSANSYVGSDSKVSYPGKDAMDCDSCHRPHLAPAGGTFSRTKAHNGTAVPVILEVQAAADEYGDFCQKCHAM